jgi:hypothetical protein
MVMSMPSCGLAFNKKNSQGHKMRVITPMIWINQERDSVIINGAYKANKFNKSAWPDVLTEITHG